MKWLDAETATALLEIKSASLYAYVSRGLVRSRGSDVDSRASLYASADIERLVSRKKAGRARDVIARGAIGWGVPVLESAITNVADGRLFFRGQDALALSDTHTLEQVASILWGEAGLPNASANPFEVSRTDAKTAGFQFLSNMAAKALPSAGRAPQHLAQEAADLLAGLSTNMALGASGANAHDKLGNLWQLDGQQSDILRRTLVVLADHELNPSTFAARVAASTGASLASSALAGYATLTGPFHGEAAARALDFLVEARHLGATNGVAAILERGHSLSGLGHRLYPEGDPRARAVLEALKPPPWLEDAITAAEEAFGAPANIDMALAAITLQMGLPKTAPFTLFAVARMAGWLAHGFEQSTSGAQIRPRAFYTGPISETG
jgi:citrate synthase